MQTGRLTHFINLLGAVAQTVIKILPHTHHRIVSVQYLNGVFLVELIERRARFTAYFRGFSRALYPCGYSLRGWIDLTNMFHAIRAGDFIFLPPDVVLISGGQVNIFTPLPVDSGFLSLLPQMVINGRISSTERGRVVAGRINVLTFFFYHPIEPVQPRDGFYIFHIFGALPGLLSGFVSQPIAKGGLGFVGRVWCNCLVGEPAQLVVLVDDL